MRRVFVTVVSVCLLCVTVLSVQPAVSASPDGGADVAEVSPVAPVWPFVGMVDYAGVFVGIPDGERFDLGLDSGLSTRECLIDAWALHLGYSADYAFFARLRHIPLASPEMMGSFVAPWGDAAYPLLTSPIVSWKSLPSSGHPFVVDRFSSHSSSMILDKYYAHYQVTSDTLRPPEESMQPFVSLGFLEAGTGPWGRADEVLRFENGRGVQHYVLASHPRFDGFLGEVDRDRAEMLLEVEEVDYDESESEHSSGWSPPSHALRVQRVSGERAIWSMGATDWYFPCVVPHSVVQDTRTGLALSCTDTVLLPVGLPSGSDLSDVPPLRGLDECPRTSWASVLAVAENNEAQAQGELPRGEAG